MTVARYCKPALIAASLLTALSLHASYGPAEAADPCVMSQATIANDEAAIRATLASYNDALNGGQTAAVLPLYTDDGVFMPPYSQSAVGRDAVRAAYDAVFRELKFVVMAPTWAYVRTNSAGTTDHRSLGKTLAEGNQELFIFKKGDDGKWRIARYSFSPTSPPIK